ncbi:MAG: ATP-dependent helicase HrpB [Hyphomicrobiaceae bacterium]
MNSFDPPLPIDDVLGPLRGALETGSNVVLVAPPGAGKTTRVPLALLGSPWLAGRKILLLEPRRIAARGAAHRMADTLRERVGGLVGMRARLGTRVGPKTRIEVVTEGVFTRMILADPGLEDVGAVLFDEFHERSLDADLGLALAIDAQAGLRPDLRLLVMSATLEGGRVAALLAGAPVIESAGRAYPVETRYIGRDPSRRLDDEMAQAVRKALSREPGSILVFLPGQAEIRRVAERLDEDLRDETVVVETLHGGLDPAAQDRAVAPAPAGRRKVVLATSIAETSLTIEGVRVVIDSGLSRVPRYEPDIAVTRLETVKASRASVDQRRGRAGRTEPGVCYRLWDEPQTASLPAFAEPEIRAADLTGLLLDCAEWGAIDPTGLAWLDPPPSAALEAARATLLSLGALDSDGRITEAGRNLRRLPLPPRIARMIVEGTRLGMAKLGGEVGALLVERGLGGNEIDIGQRLAAFRRDRGRRASDMRAMAARWVEAAGTAAGRAGGDTLAESTQIAALLAAAYPDRIAKARGARGQFLMASGRAGFVDATDPLAGAEFLVVAEMHGKAAATRIVLAAPATAAEIELVAGSRITKDDQVVFDPASGAVRARRVRRLGAIVLEATPRAVTEADDVAAVLANAAASAGIERLPWSRAQQQLRDRVAFLREGDPGWPDLSDEALSATAGDWLAPYLGARTRLADITASDLAAALDTLLPHALRRRLDDEAPTHFEAPTGSRHAIDYEGAGAPRVAIRVQELFGLARHPAIAAGRLPLTLELLSPAGRPMQVTRDLPGFWAGSWADVRSDMRGRYPKHVWPEDPAKAAPTARAKPRGT